MLPVTTLPYVEPLVQTMQDVFALKTVHQLSRMFVLLMDEVLTTFASFSWITVEHQQTILTSIMAVAEVNEIYIYLSLMYTDGHG